MAAPVWLLTVDLQTKTASFTTGLADAAKKARSSFASIGAGAEEMGEATGRGFGTLRNKLGLIDNTIRGAHAQAMADLIRMFSESSIVMGALPIAATVAGIALIGGIVFELVKKMESLRLAQEKAADSELDLETAANTTFTSLDDRLLTAEKRVDELNNDHLAALNKELQIIGNESLEPLMRALDNLQKHATEAFKNINAARWDAWNTDPTVGASHALDAFKHRYDELASSGDSKGASGLLHGTLGQAQRILDLQEQFSKQYKGADLLDVSANRSLLRQAGGNGDYSANAIAAQRTLVQVLKDMADAEGKANAGTNEDKKAARLQTALEMQQRSAEGARQSAEAMLQMGQASISADKATADAGLEIHRASLEQRLQSDIDFAGRERDVKLAANAAEVQALDKAGKDYQNQLKNLQDKQLEIQNDYAAKVGELTATENVAAYHRDVENMITAEREKIQATREGSAERLAALDAAIAEEAAKGLQQTEQYRNLLAERAQMERKVQEDARKDAETAAREEASHAEKMGQLRIAAEQGRMAVSDSIRKVSRERQVQEATRIANEERDIKLHALMDEVAGLDKNGKDYEAKLKALHDKEIELIRQHENEVTDIREKAEIQRNQAIMSSRDRFDQALASGLTQSIMRHEYWSQMLIRLGDQVISGMIQNAIMSMLTADMDKEKQAAHAARLGFNAGLKFPFPANLAMAPVLGAAMFAQVMAFEAGTDKVAGVGRGDVVPAMLTPGEGVVPGGVMDGLRNVANRGGFQEKPSHVVMFRPTYYVQTIDGDGWSAALEKHATETQRHIETTLRSMNR